jgi:hypothetical protein
MATSMFEGFYFIVAGKLDANIFSHLFWKLCKSLSIQNYIVLHVQYAKRVVVSSTDPTFEEEKSLVTLGKN